MPIDRITAAQFVAKLRTALLARTNKYDTAYGPIPDVVFNPTAAVLEDQNNRLRLVSLLLSLRNESEFSEDDLDALVYNEGILRPTGSNATTVLTFQRSTPFTSAETGRIPKGFPVGTAVSEGGITTTFVTTEEKDKSSVIEVLDTDTNTIVYQVQVPATCLTRGSAGRVGSDRINRPLRPLVGYESVTNAESTKDGRDQYTNAELVQLYLLAVTSRQLSVPSGAEFYIRDNFTSVQDVHEVFGTDPLLTRAADNAGAVDAFVIGENVQSKTDQLTFLGVGQKLKIVNAPVIEIQTVTRVSDSHLYVEGTDYVVDLDKSGVSGSTRAQDGIRFLATASPMPSAGDVISVVYSYNQLVRDLQADASDPEVQVIGRDLLFRVGVQVDITMAAQLKVSSGFRYNDIETAVNTAILGYINGLKLGEDVELSDLQAEVRRFSGVDNFVITRLTRSTASSGATDISIAANEYARISIAELTLTPLS